MSVMNRAVDDSYREHSKAVVQGFDALRDEYRALDYRCNELQSRLETLANQVCTLPLITENAPKMRHL